MSDVSTVFALGAQKKANNALKKINDNKLLIPKMLRPLPLVTTNPPTVTIGIKNGTSVITGAVDKLPITSTTVTQQPFRYAYGDFKRADYSKGSQTYTGLAPDNKMIRNFAVTSTNNFGNVSAEFTFDGSEFEFPLKALAGQNYQVSVDEGQGYQLITTDPQGLGVSDGGVYRVDVNFGSRKLRRIKIEIAGGYFGGVTIGANDTVFPPARPLGIRALFFGDSFTEGTGATGISQYSSFTSKILGWEHWASGSGGTGYLNNGPTGRVVFRDRVQTDVIAYKPDVVVIEGGTNDTTFDPSTLQTEVDTLLKQIKQGLPNTKIIVLSNWAVQGTTAAITNTRDAIKTASLANKLPFIDSIAGITYNENGVALNEASGMWITGLGNTASPQATGNATYYTYTDNGHPSVAGHRYLGERLATEIYRLLIS
jgi:lysophospholipase L1-like esterase